MTIYFIAGEVSGDARGAELMKGLRELAPDLHFTGSGGCEMRALAGGDFRDWADEAVVGLWDVIKKYGFFREQFAKMLAEVAERKPDAVVLIDYTGFNLRFAKACRSRFPGLKTIYYVSPQVWAWNRGRIKEMARTLDLMLCIFPFEQPLYEASGLRTVFVGHPMLDTLESKKIADARDPRLVGIFPGSRTKEIRRIFPAMLDAAIEMRKARGDLRFEVAAASAPLAELIRSELGSRGLGEDFCAVTLRSSHSLMQRACAGMVCSGTATLEAAYFGLPMAILYKVAPLTWLVAKRLVTVPFLGMPNVLAGREIAREFLQHDCAGAPVAQEILRLVSDESARRIIQSELAAVIGKLGERGAGRRAAEAIVRELGIASK